MSISTTLAESLSLIHYCSYLILEIVLLAYLLTVRCLRYRRCHQIRLQFESPERPLSSMSAKEAYNIMRQLQELEFPYNLHNALSFGLLKVCRHFTANTDI